MFKFFTLLLFLFSLEAFGWGELGHRLVVEYSAKNISEKSYSKCHTSLAEILSHTNDPDKIWRHKSRDFPQEKFAHYFHLDIQKNNWQETLKPQNIKDGFLPFRILNWIDLAKKSLKDKDYDSLHKYLYGLSHYIGDLSQPLHLNHDYNGTEAGVESIHSQFETQMLNKYEDQLRKMVKDKTDDATILTVWKMLSPKKIITDTAIQTNMKASLLFKNAKLSLIDVSGKKKKKGKRSENQKIRFSKPMLWEENSSLASDQIALSSKLWAFVFNDICKE